MQGAGGDQNTVLRMLSFKDYKYTTTPEIYELEQKQLRGSDVLIEGTKLY